MNTDQDSKPRVLLLGDSIRMSCQPRVAELLADAANVVGPADNCRFSLYALSRLPTWLAELGRPDVMHLSPQGSETCAQAVAAAVREELRP